MISLYLTTYAERLVLRPDLRKEGAWALNTRITNSHSDFRCLSVEPLARGFQARLGIPPRSFWLNVHPDVLHLWEIRDEALLAQWKAERQGQRPT